MYTSPGELRRKNPGSIHSSHRKGRIVMTRIISVGLAAMAAAFCASWPAHADEGYGDLVGEFILEGAIPQPRLLHKAGDVMVKDTAICAARDTYDGETVIDPASKGIANIFVYMTSVEFQKISGKLPPELKAAPEKELVSEQRDCTITPHVMLVRVGQTVRLNSADPTAHSMHLHPISNEPQNTTFPANRELKLLPFDRAERVPIPVKCDIHGWMVSYWLILDHPYAAITNTQGKFTIAKLPAGEHTFRLWHERQGYIRFTAEAERTVHAGKIEPGVKYFDLRVKIESGKQTDLGKIMVPAAKMERKAQ
jgi:hypothetical protein